MNAKPLILAIDDAPVNLKTLVAALSEDYDLQVTTSGPEGLAQAAATPPDLILLDVMMPGMDGYEVCRRLKADPRLCDIPVIFISAMAESEAEASGLDLGAVDYLTKPINVPIAQRRIHNQLERDALRKAVEHERSRLEEQVRERTLALSIAKEAAETANRLKTTILTNLNHEFRTPMNGLLGMLTLARRKVSDPKALDNLANAERSANRLHGILTGLLDLALVESNRMTLERRIFRAADVATEAIRQLTAEARARHLTVDCLATAGPQAADWLTGGSLRIGQILHELISNAIKFSEHGRIIVESSVSQEPTGTLRLGYAVRDEGIGIAPENLPHVFKAFHQVDGSLTRHYGGNGIGLALCQQLVRHMGGEIRVESTLGAGTTFAFSLPVEASQAPASSDGRPDLPTRLAQRHRHAGAHILIAEDDPANGELIRAVLESAGLEAYLAADGAQAVNAARCAQFDLILMDLMMPNIAGLEATLAIRALPNYDRTPILALTAKAFESDREDSLRAGMNAHIVKPFNNDTLLDSVLTWLDRTAG